MTTRALSVALAAFSCVLWSEHASGFERQWHLGGGPGFVNASPSEIGLGMGVNGYAAYGLSDMFDLKLDVSASSHEVELAGASQRHMLYTASLGVAYKIDIIEWIPYIGVHAGYMFFDLPEASTLDMERNDMILGGMLGLDYAVTRSFGLGLMNRLHVPLGGSNLVDLFLRAEYRWGW